MDQGLSQRVQDWEQALLDVTQPFVPDGGLPRIDVHVHLGIDAGTGSEMTLEAIERQVSMAGIDRCVLVPLNASDGYRVANDRLAEVAAESNGRFDFLVRVDPSDVGAAGVERLLDAGAAGLKLHPHSDGARPGDPRLREVLELAAERGRMVLVHAGIDVDGVSDEIMDVAAALPGAHFVVGHVAADRLAGTARRVRELGNVFTCTAWWGLVDLAWAMSWSSPTHFLFGSDPPFGTIPLGMVLTTRVARCVGYDDDAVRAVLGGNALRLLDDLPSADPPDPGPPDPDPAQQLLARLPAHWQRCYVSLEISAALAEAGTDPSSQLQLADAALEPELVEDHLRHDAELVHRGIQLARDLHAANESRHAYVVTVGALTLCGTSPILVPAD